MENILQTVIVIKKNIRASISFHCPFAMEPHGRDHEAPRQELRHKRDKHDHDARSEHAYNCFITTFKVIRKFY